MGQTKTTRSISATGLFLLIMMTVGLYSCTRTQKDIIPSADYAPYVNAYTGGVISQNSTIRIELTHDQPMVDLNSELKNNPFSFSPSLKGTGNTLRRNFPARRLHRSGQKAERVQLLIPCTGT